MSEWDDLEAAVLPTKKTQKPTEPISAKEQPKEDWDALEAAVLPKKTESTSSDKPPEGKYFTLNATKFGAAENIPVVGDMLKGYSDAEKDQLMQERIAQQTPKDERMNPIQSMEVAGTGAIAGALKGTQDLYNTVAPKGMPLARFGDQFANNPTVANFKAARPGEFGGGNTAGSMVPAGVAAEAAGAGAAGIMAKPALGILGKAVLGAAARIPGGVQDVLRIAGGALGYGGVPAAAAEGGKQATAAGKTGPTDMGKVMQAGMQGAAQALPLAGAAHIGGAMLNKAFNKTAPPAKPMLRIGHNPNIPDDVINYQAKAQNNQLLEQKPHLTEQTQIRDELRRLNPGAPELPPTKENLEYARHAKVSQLMAEQEQAKLKGIIEEKQQKKLDVKAEKKRLKEIEADEHNRKRMQRMEEQKRISLNFQQQALESKIEAQKAIEESKQKTVQDKTTLARETGEQRIKALQGKVELTEQASELIKQKQKLTELEAEKEEAKSKGKIDLNKSKSESKDAELQKRIDYVKMQIEKEQEKERISKEDHEFKQKQAEDKALPSFDKALANLNDATTMREFEDALALAHKIYRLSIRSQDVFVKSAYEKRFNQAKLENRARLENTDSKFDNASERTQDPNGPKNEVVPKYKNPEPYNPSPSEALQEQELKDYKAAFEPRNEQAQRESRPDLEHALGLAEENVRRIQTEDQPSPEIRKIARQLKDSLKEFSPEFWARQKASAAMKDYGLMLGNARMTVNELRAEIARRNSYKEMDKDSLEYFSEHGNEEQKRAAKDLLEPEEETTEQKEARWKEKYEDNYGSGDRRKISDETFGKRERTLIGGVQKFRRLEYPETDPIFVEHFKEWDGWTHNEDTDWDAEDRALERFQDVAKQAREVGKDLPPEEQAEAIKKAFPHIEPELNAAEKELKRDGPLMYADPFFVGRIFEFLAPMLDFIAKKFPEHPESEPNPFKGEKNYTPQGVKNRVTFARFWTGVARDTDLLSRHSRVLAGALQDFDRALADSAHGINAMYDKMTDTVNAAEVGHDFSGKEGKILIQKSRGLTGEAILNGEGPLKGEAPDKLKALAEIKFAIEDFADTTKPFLEPLKDMDIRPHTRLASIKRILEHYQNLAYPERGVPTDPTLTGITELVANFTKSLFLFRWAVHWLHAYESAFAGLSSAPVEFVHGLISLKDAPVRDFNEHFHGAGPIFSTLDDISGQKPLSLPGRVLKYVGNRFVDPLTDPIYKAANANPTARLVLQALRGKAIETAFKSIPIRTAGLVREAYKRGLEPVELAKQLNAHIEGHGGMTHEEFTEIIGGISKYANDNIGQNPTSLSNRNILQRNPLLRFMEPFSTAMSNQTYRLAAYIDDAAEAIRDGDRTKAALHLTSFLGMIGMINLVGKGNGIPREVEAALKMIDKMAFYDLKHWTSQASFLAEIRDVHHVQWAIFPFLWAASTMPETIREQARHAGEGKLDGLIGVSAMFGASDIGQTMGTLATYQAMKNLSNAVQGWKDYPVFSKGGTLMPSKFIGMTGKQHYDGWNAFWDTATAGEDPLVSKLKENLEEVKDYKDWLKKHAPERYVAILHAQQEQQSEIRKTLHLTKNDLANPELKELVKDYIHKNAVQPDWHAIIEQVQREQTNHAAYSNVPVE